ncbi:MAG: DUF421 domain-containing protein [Bacillaceae bacterium]|nr:DUF421 domain-containing protein [Bacillaceae bacterium]
MEAFYQYLIVPVAIFVAGYLLLRFSGKKAVSEMGVFDLLIVILIGNIISQPVVSGSLGIALWYGLVVTGIYIFYTYMALNNKFRWMAHPSPTVVIRGGDIDEEGLRQSKLTVKQLLEKLRNKGYANPADVEIAIFESDGKFSVIPKAKARPIQPGDIQNTPQGFTVQPQPTFLPIPLIMEGEIIDHNLKYAGKNKKWLYEQLHGYGIQEESLNKVTLATLDQNGKVTLDLEKSDILDGDPNNYMPGNDN